MGASIALHAAAIGALVPFHYSPSAAADAPLQITVIAAAGGEPADLTSPVAPAQDAAMPEQPVPAATPPDQDAPLPVESAASVEQTLPKVIVPQAPTPPEPDQVALAPPPVVAVPEATQSHHPVAKVMPNRPRVVKAAAHVTPPPSPIAQGEGEASASATAAAPVPASAGPASADALSAWQAALIAWLDAHRAYPEGARARGEEGAVGVRFTLTESGDVTEADIQRGSGSTTLDDATLAMLRGAHLPAPPPGTDAARRTISVSIRYRLN